MTLQRVDSPACRFHLDKKASHDQGIKAQSIPLERGGRQSCKSKSRRVIFFSKCTRWPKKTCPQLDLLSCQREQQLWVGYFSASAFKIQTPCKCLFVPTRLFQILWFTMRCIFCPDLASFTRRWYQRMAGRVTMVTCLSAIASPATPCKWKPLNC